ncbi:hypothetical protein LX99_04130 [Mucilaginibacter oryzae]|uniref:Uncharacterized protein n=1 Tax=Mucilaginibacter oryzae TaxID=468058 RepID=A0A316HII4_9SPHI|nr:hypothetical protein [Mucilaginibacter oryzae]PWK73745.1 hypothetical protein LX99_04130 [Mucilaginibacter oryzae]
MKKIIFLFLIGLFISTFANAKSIAKLKSNSKITINGVQVLLPTAIGKSTSFIEYGSATTLKKIFKVDKCYKVSTVQIGTGVVTDANGNVTNTFPIYETTVTEIPCP